MADTLDVLTLAEGRVAVGMDGADTSEDTELAQAITAISRRLDDRCGPIVVRTYTDVEMDGNSGDLQLPHWPVTSITSISERSSLAASWTALTTSQWGYRTMGVDGLYSGRVRRINTGWAPYVKATWVAGRYAATASVGAQFKEAATVALEVWWQRRRPSFTVTSPGEFPEPRVSFPTFALPNAAVALLGDEARAEGLLVL